MSTTVKHGKEDPRVADLAKACLRQHLHRYGVVSDAMLSALVEARIEARAASHSQGGKQNSPSLASPFSSQQLSIVASAAVAEADLAIAADV